MKFLHAADIHLDQHSDWYRRTFVNRFRNAYRIDAVEYIKAIDGGCDLVSLQVANEVPSRQDIRGSQFIDFRGGFLHAVLAEIS